MWWHNWEVFGTARRGVQLFEGLFVVVVQLCVEPVGVELQLFRRVFELLRLHLFLGRETLLLHACMHACMHNLTIHRYMHTELHA